MLRFAIASSLCLALCACGDDGKVGSTAPPSGAPAAAPPAVSPPTPSATEPTGPTGWAGTRVGDWAAWEIRATGTDSVTRLTWRAKGVEAGRIAFSIESKTTAADGHVVASTSTEEIHDAAADPTADFSRAKGDDMTVSGVRLSTSVHAAAGDKKVWTSEGVPFSGVVKASGGGVEQMLVAFGRGR